MRIPANIPDVIAGAFWALFGRLIASFMPEHCLRSLEKWPPLHRAFRHTVGNPGAIWSLYVGRRWQPHTQDTTPHAPFLFSGPGRSLAWLLPADTLDMPWPSNPLQYSARTVPELCQNSGLFTGLQCGRSGPDGQLPFTVQSTLKYHKPFFVMVDTTEGYSPDLEPGGTNDLGEHLPGERVEHGCRACFSLLVFQLTDLFRAVKIFSKKVIFLLVPFSGLVVIIERIRFNG